MATDTVRPGAFENATGMATVTADVLVRAVEFETGAVVVERFLRHRCGAQQQGAQ